MSRFKSFCDYRFFSDEVREERRFFLGDEAKRFLEAISDQSNDRKLSIPKGIRFSRARKENTNRTEADTANLEGADRSPFSCKEMKPTHKKQTTDKTSFVVPDGRVRPRGIPCLYLASDKKTATIEVRPTDGEFVTVAEFRTTRALTLVRFRQGAPADENRGLQDIYDLSLPGADEDAFQSKVDRDVWGEIDLAFSKPVERDGEYLDYVPTQIIAESLLARGGYDGIVYRSSLNPEGFNLALFDLDDAKCISTRLVCFDSGGAVR